MLQEQAILTVGTLVRGRYQVKSVLGSGGTGTVYLVKDQQDQNPKYTLLVLKEFTGLAQQARYEFTFHGTILRQLQHPVLPRIHTIFNDDKRGCVYLVMDYIEGRSLADIGHCNWSDLRTWCEPLVRALIYLHYQEKPFFHGDLKPTNVCQSRSGKVMLLDMGYAPGVVLEAPARETQPNPYRAPEQFAGEISALSDVYGLGALLYTLLTGQEPVDALTRRERINKRKSDPLVLASKLEPAVPRPLANALHQALALDPARRFASVRAFWETLNAFSEPVEAPVTDEQYAPMLRLLPASQSVTLTPIRHAESARSTSTWRRALLPGIVVLSALLLLLLGAGTWAWSAAHSQVATTNRVNSSTAHGGTTPTSNPGSYPNMQGRYGGTLSPVDQPVSRFTLIVKHQVQGRISGTFSSPSFQSTQQNGTFAGTIDSAGDLRLTVFDNSGNAFLAFAGGFNGMPNTTDSLGGTFYSCLPGNGANCQQDSQGLSGLWVLNYLSSAFVPPPGAEVPEVCMCS